MSFIKYIIHGLKVKMETESLVNYGIIKSLIDGVALISNLDYVLMGELLAVSVLYIVFIIIFFTRLLKNIVINTIFYSKGVKSVKVLLGFVSIVVILYVISTKGMLLQLLDENLNFHLLAKVRWKNLIIKKLAVGLRKISTKELYKGSSEFAQILSTKLFTSSGINSDVILFKNKVMPTGWIGQIYASLIYSLMGDIISLMKAGVEFDVDKYKWRGYRYQDGRIGGRLYILMTLLKIVRQLETEELIATFKMWKELDFESRKREFFKYGKKFPYQSKYLKNQLKLIKIKKK